MARLPPLRYRDKSGRWRDEKGWAKPPTGRYRGRNGRVYERPPKDVNRKPKRPPPRPAGPPVRKNRAGRWVDARGQFAKKPTLDGFAAYLESVTGWKVEHGKREGRHGYYFECKADDYLESARSHAEMADIFREIAAAKPWGEFFGHRRSRAFLINFSEERLRRSAARRGMTIDEDALGGEPDWMAVDQFGSTQFSEMLTENAGTVEAWHKRYKGTANVGLGFRFW